MMLVLALGILAISFIERNDSAFYWTTIGFLLRIRSGDLCPHRPVEGVVCGLPLLKILICNFDFTLGTQTRRLLQKTIPPQMDHRLATIQRCWPFLSRGMPLYHWS